MIKIAIDAGHGKNTAGKRSPDGSLLEYEFNRDVAKRLKEILVSNGISVIETAATDEDIALRKRCDIANVNKVDYFISIHADGWYAKDKKGKEIIDWNSANGWSIHIIAKGGKAEKLAESIRRHAIPGLKLRDRGVCVSNFQVLRDTNMPAVLIEHAFYTNKFECDLLKTNEFRQKCAEVDAQGILDFLGIENKKIGNEIIENEMIEWANKNEIMKDMKMNENVTKEIFIKTIFDLHKKGVI